MLLLNIFTVLKYGAKIFLAVMGFISFDDINEKPVGNSFQNHASIENINYVEALQGDELMFSENLCYADFNYTTKENEQQEPLFAQQFDYLVEKDFSEFNIHFGGTKVDSENYFILEGEDIKDFEILVFQECDNLEFEYLIKVVEDNNISSMVINSVKFRNIPNSATIY